MTWALWRWQHGRERALKAHVKFNVLREKPVAVVITAAKRCARAVLREHWQRGEFYVGDRYSGEDYGLFAELPQAGCSLVLRLRQEAVFEVIEELALTAEDRAANRTFDGLVRLGARPQHPPVRLVRGPTEASELLLVTDQPRAEWCAALVGEICSQSLADRTLLQGAQRHLGLPPLAGRIPAGRGAADFLRFDRRAPAAAGHGPPSRQTGHGDDPLLSPRLRAPR